MIEEQHPCSSPRRSITARGEIAAMWRYCREAGVDQDLRRLHRPRPWISFRAAVLDWVAIVTASAAAARWGGVVVVLALIVIGNRQRALGNLLHDASHGSLDGKRRRGLILANALLCWPLWVSMRVYRTDHLAHHRFLGDPARDPDFIHDERLLHRGWLHLWWSQIADGRTFRMAVLSHLGRMSPRELAAVAGWWGGVLGVTALALGPVAALGFLGLWIGARAVAFHPITAFREISDHVGLVPGTLIGFSRNHPVRGWMSHFFHPHNNGFHLLHHLMPGLPFHAFPAAHRLLHAWAPYREAAQCTSYFLGETAATRSWVRSGSFSCGDSH